MARAGLSARPGRRRVLAGAVAGVLAPWCFARAARGATVPRAPASDEGEAAAGRAADAPLFELSLAQWSLHRALRAGELDVLDFPAVAAERFGVRAVETVNTFYKDKVADFAWLARLRAACAAAGVRHLLVMVDGEGELAHPDRDLRDAALAAHHRWVAAAGFLGCHAVRVNLHGGVEREAAARHAADALARLARFAEPYGVSVLVENHGGFSSDGGWLAGVLAAADHPGVGSLPDFGNFVLPDGSSYDRYRGVEQLMPFAKAVSAKAHDFDAAGNERHIDYRRMLRLVLASGYRGHVGIEYEGSALSEEAGIRATRDLLLRLRDELEPEFR